MQATAQSPDSSTPAIARGVSDAGLRPRRTALQSVVFFLSRNHLVLFGLIIVVLWIIVTLAAPLLAPYDPLQQDIVHRLQPPNKAHWFGTDQLGRDILTRVMYGGRISLPAALAVVVLAGAVGTVLGAIAGYFGGAVEELFMRVTDVFMAFPTIILAMAIAAALGPNVSNAILAMTIVWWPRYARIIRSLVLTVKEEEYVLASLAAGSSEMRVLRRVVVPNSVAPAVVMATLDLGNAILLFAGLSFLGLGPEPSTPEWGRMISDGLAFFDQWWVSAFPGLAIFTVVMAFNFIGDGLRDAMDPRVRNL
jgi:peptide/nickel transport system permease protein